MMSYSAPLRDMRFVMEEVLNLSGICALAAFKDVSPDVVVSVLQEADRFASEVLAPLNRIGDQIGASWDRGRVTTPPGWQAAYRQFAQGGWQAVTSAPDLGGQGLPKLVAAGIMEMWNSANMAFALCPMLTNGAMEALVLCGSEELRTRYLPPMIAGRWTGTMNLTEPQAGSDLAGVRTRAEPRADGSYGIFGQKIFITYGEHDLTENIIHLVLARLPDAPEGIKGISLFLVPKFLVQPDGSLGARNDVQCIALEHKLGIHASPTCVLAYGEAGGATGYLVGEAHRGLEYMFIMMNQARFAVGMEGLALSERAYQQALAYARQRIQGTAPGVREGPKVSIIQHPDVRRMLMSMKAQIEAMRALAYKVAASGDQASHHPDPLERARHQAFVDLMIPVVKGWSTENGVEITSTGIQIHGGMGYIEETGAAQHFRDARIAAIYEGTTGIQANDLIGRKIVRDGGSGIAALLGQMRGVAEQLAAVNEAHCQALASSLNEAIAALAGAVEFVLATYAEDVSRAAAGAVPLLKLLGVVAGGWMMGQSALVAQSKLSLGTADRGFYQSKLATARFFADHCLPHAVALAHGVIHGAPGTLALEDSQF